MIINQYLTVPTFYLQGIQSPTIQYLSTASSAGFCAHAPLIHAFASKSGSAKELRSIIVSSTTCIVTCEAG